MRCLWHISPRAGVRVHGPSATSVQARARCSSTKSDRAAMGFEASPKGGGSDRRMLPRLTCALRSRGPEQASLASGCSRRWTGERRDRGCFLGLPISRCQQPPYRAWFKLLGTKVTLCMTRFVPFFDATDSGMDTCAKSCATLCNAKYYPVLNHAPYRARYSGEPSSEATTMSLVVVPFCKAVTKALRLVASGATPMYFS